MYTRKKEVTLDNISITVSPLTCGQADSFLEEQTNIIKEAALAAPEDRAKYASKIEKLWYQFVVDGINNASNESTSKWTVERLRAELDKVFIQLLLETIKEMSGLVTKGETQATS